MKIGDTVSFELDGELLEGKVWGLTTNVPEAWWIQLSDNSLKTVPRTDIREGDSDRATGPSE